jgi:hypothetical protein
VAAISNSYSELEQYAQHVARVNFRTCDVEVISRKEPANGPNEFKTTKKVWQVIEERSEDKD